MQFCSVLPLTGLRTHSSVFQRRAEHAILQEGPCQDDCIRPRCFPPSLSACSKVSSWGLLNQGSGFQLCSSGAVQTRLYLPERYVGGEDLGTCEGTTHFTHNNSCNLPLTYWASFLILTTTRRGSYPCPHFTDALTEGRKGE